MISEGVFLQSEDKSWQRKGRLELCSRFYSSTHTPPLPPIHSRNIMFHDDTSCDNFSGRDFSVSSFEQNGGMSGREDATTEWPLQSKLQVHSYQHFYHDEYGHPSHNNDHLHCFNLSVSNNNNHERNTDGHDQLLNKVNDVLRVIPSSFTTFHQNGRSQNESKIFMNMLESEINAPGLLCDNDPNSMYYSPLRESSSDIEAVGCNDAMFESIAEGQNSAILSSKNLMHTFSETKVRKSNNIPVITLDDDDDDEDFISLHDGSPLETAVQVSVIKLNKGQNNVRIVDLEENSFDSCADHNPFNPTVGDILVESYYLRSQSFHMKGIFNPYIKIRSTVIKKSTGQNNNLGPSETFKTGFDCYFQVIRQLSTVNPTEEIVLTFPSPKKKSCSYKFLLKYEKELRSSFQPEALKFFSMLPFKFLKLCKYQHCFPMLSLIVAEQDIQKVIYGRKIQGYCYVVPVLNKIIYLPSYNGEQEKGGAPSTENNYGVVGAKEVFKNISRPSVGLYLVKRTTMKKAKAAVDSKPFFVAVPSWLNGDLKLLLRKVRNILDLDGKHGVFRIEPIQIDHASLVKEQYNVKFVEQSLKMLFTKKLLSAKSKSCTEYGNSVKHFNQLSAKDKKNTILLSKRRDGFENVGQEPIHIILHKLGIYGYPFLVSSEVSCNAIKKEQNSFKNVLEVNVFNQAAPGLEVSKIRSNNEIDKILCPNKITNANSTDFQEILKNAGCYSYLFSESQNNHGLTKQELKAVTDSLRATNVSTTTDVWTKQVLLYQEQLMSEELNKKSSSDDIVKILKNSPNFHDFKTFDNLNQRICQIMKQNEDSGKDKVALKCDDLCHQILSTNQPKNQNYGLNQSTSKQINTDSPAQLLQTNVPRNSHAVNEEEAAEAMLPLEQSEVTQKELSPMPDKEKSKRIQEFSEISKRNLSLLQCAQSCSCIGVQTENCLYQQLESLVDERPSWVMSKFNNHAGTLDCSKNHNRENRIKTACPKDLRTVQAHTNLDLSETITSETSDCILNSLVSQNMDIEKIRSSSCHLKVLSAYQLDEELKNFEKFNVSKNVNVEKCNPSKNLSVTEYLQRKSCGAMCSKNRLPTFDHPSEHQLTTGKGSGRLRSGGLKRKRLHYSASTSSPCKYCKKSFNQHSPDGNCGTSDETSNADNVRTYYDPDCFVDIASSAMTSEDEDALERVVAERDVFVYYPRRPAATDPRLNADTLQQYSKVHTAKKVRFKLQSEIQSISLSSKKRKKGHLVDHFDPSVRQEVHCHYHEGLKLELPSIKAPSKIDSHVKSADSMSTNRMPITNFNLEKLAKMRFSEKCEMFLEYVDPCPSVSISCNSPEDPFIKDSRAKMGSLYDTNLCENGAKFKRDSYLKQSPCVKRIATVPLVPFPNNAEPFITKKPKCLIICPECPTIASSFECPHMSNLTGDGGGTSEGKSRDDVSYSPGSPTSTIVLD